MLDECPDCGSSEVYCDVTAGSRVESALGTVENRWYDCTDCGVRILEKIREKEPTHRQIEDNGDRESDFEISKEYLK